jgi:pyrimidine-nucleoside phosphorylase
MMKIQDIIARKRDKGSHSQEELSWLVQAALNGEATDYQLAAWLMAAYLNGLNEDETAWLTLAMACSGERLDLSSLPGPWVDKHSTGGVGDKTTLVVLPMLTACGLTTVKMSGRGLGITGGTLDKLSSVPGFRMDLTPQEMIEQAKRVGVVLSGQTPLLAPADKILYALRDATATVDSIPLIVASVLSKKIAGGAETIVLDVKCGSGAFMESYKEACALADMLSETARHCGINVRIVITDMSQPLGSMIGNALEVQEMVSVLRGETKGRFVELCVDMVGLTLYASGVVESLEVGEQKALESLTSGRALEKARIWFEAQGAPGDFFEKPDKYLPKAPVVFSQCYEGRAGWIQKWDARAVGETVVDLGGGRRHKEDTIDVSVGIRSFIEVGSKVERGTPLFEVHAKDLPSAEKVAERLARAIAVSETPVQPQSVFLRGLE